MTIKDIDDKIDSLSDELHELRKKRISLLMEDKNFEGKFVKSELEGGYMFVTWQTILSIKPDHVFLQGISFYTELSEEYRDSAAFNFDAMREWYIPKNLFLNGDIKEVTKEEFMEEFKKGFTNSLQFGLNWINKITEDYKE